ncbi:RluA family pseudouridine synthase [Paenalcaligenes hominis]|uniref:Pseudouridine synthase n=1 Tax=Paenalcaligenes hominis TaxID=643674 RepID=A0ABX0WTQ1_9BURK|nr:RluA family pseudouridine synthase [Paenalcaligenes hominis]NJB66155.1 23S rRNA pseudouridine1911/1915/1917 synthase [Paenalcaligenes hominis]GGE73522.1 pseudouridine synthase [Paenalcaligenes hominis]
MNSAPHNTENSPELEFRVPLSALPERLDKTVAQLLPEHSRSRIQAWIESGHVLVNGQSVRTRHMVMPGDVLLVHPQARPEELAYEAEDIPLHIVAQSPHWVVINKPAGLVTHPGAGNWTGTLLNGLLHHFPQLTHVARAGIVHRLDKDTSGLMVVALTEQAQTHLVRQLQERSVLREYIALCHGFLYGSGTIDLAVGRDARVPVRMATQNAIAPRHAKTHYEVLNQGLFDRGIAVSYVQCRLETGRTHQIRVHLSSQNHPLLGDEIYGGKPLAGAARQMLHARALQFIDPATESPVRVDAEAPADFQAVYEQIEWKNPSQP